MQSVIDIIEMFAMFDSGLEYCLTYALLRYHKVVATDQIVIFIWAALMFMKGLNNIHAWKDPFQKSLIVASISRELV